MSEYLTLKKAAQVSGYHQDYLSQLIRSGRLPGRRLGKEWVTSRLAVAEYLASRGKKPIDKAVLRLPWHRRNRKFLITSLIGIGLASILFGGSLKSVATQVMESDFDSHVLIDEQTVLVDNGEFGVTQAIVITGYALDENGETQLSISTKQ